MKPGQVCMAFGITGRAAQGLLVELSPESIIGQAGVEARAGAGLITHQQLLAVQQRTTGTFEANAPGVGKRDRDIVDFYNTGVGHPRTLC